MNPLEMAINTLNSGGIARLILLMFILLMVGAWIIGLGNIAITVITRPGQAVAGAAVVVIAAVLISFVLDGWTIPMPPAPSNVSIPTAAPSQPPQPDQPSAISDLEPIIEPTVTMMPQPQAAATAVPAPAQEIQTEPAAGISTDWQPYNGQIVRSGCPVVMIDRTINATAQTLDLQVTVDGAVVLQTPLRFSDRAETPITVGKCQIVVAQDTSQPGPLGLPPVIWRWAN